MYWDKTTLFVPLDSQPVKVYRRINWYTTTLKTENPASAWKTEWRICINNQNKFLELVWCPTVFSAFAYGNKWWTTWPKISAQYYHCSVWNNTVDSLSTLAILTSWLVKHPVFISAQYDSVKLFEIQSISYHCIRTNTPLLYSHCVCLRSHRLEISNAAESYSEIHSLCFQYLYMNNIKSQRE